MKRREKNKNNSTQFMTQTGVTTNKSIMLSDQRKTTYNNNININNDNNIDIHKTNKETFS